MAEKQSDGAMAKVVCVRLGEVAGLIIQTRKF
jgi:hypothetical protein